MSHLAAVIGAGVSGLTTATMRAERGARTIIFAEELAPRITSSAAGAIWFPYDAAPTEKVLPWSMTTLRYLRDLSRDPRSGVSMIELRQMTRAETIEIPEWASELGARLRGELPAMFGAGFSMSVPMIDTGIYLNYLRGRFLAAGGEIRAGIHFDQCSDVPPEFSLIINCAGIGARDLVPDPALEPHRGQIALVEKFDLAYAIVCDDSPLCYAFPRSQDVVFGGTNDISEERAVNLRETEEIVAECCRVLGVASPRLLEVRVGLRPFRRSGVRVERELLPDGRVVIHNYGHGGSGFTLSWGCAEEAVQLAES